jgi:hypothetical protein
MSLDFAAGPQDGDALSMLRAILSQNSQILAQNADMNARLAEVEKEQKRAQHSTKNRPRSKCADGMPWKCPACGCSTLKHLDSFISHIRKLAVLTIHRASRKRHARCRLDLENPQHRALVEKFEGVGDAEKAASFVGHFLNVCRTISASGTSVQDKHSRIVEWLQRVLQDPTFNVAGDCPSVSDTFSSDSSTMQAGSSGSDAAYRVRLRP